jgi:hypothetical protein
MTTLSKDTVNVSPRRKKSAMSLTWRERTPSLSPLRNSLGERPSFFGHKRNVNVYSKLTEEREFKKDKENESFGNQEILEGIGEQSNVMFPSNLLTVSLKTRR